MVEALRESGFQKCYNSHARPLACIQFPFGIFQWLMCGNGLGNDLPNARDALKEGRPLVEYLLRATAIGDQLAGHHGPHTGHPSQSKDVKHSCVTLLHTYY